MLNKKRIAIFVVFICCLFFMTTFAGGTTQNTVVATRLVTFIDGYNNNTISEQTINVGTDAEVPDDPSHQNLVFAGWYRYDNQEERVTNFTNILEDLKVIAKYAGDLNGNGIADDDETRYTVTFKDSFDGSILGTEQVLPGMSATAPNVPIHAGRTFIGWQGNYTNVNRNVEVTATYRVDEILEPVVDVVEDIYYTVTFINGDTNEVMDVVRLREGLTAQTPTIPEITGRVFDYWDGDYSNVTSNRTVRLMYTDDLNGDGIRDYLETHYTVEFVILAYRGGIHGTLKGTLKYENLVAGLTVEVPIAISENSNYHVEWRKMDGMTSQLWTREDSVVVDGNAIYTVSFIPNTDMNNDGKADEEQTYTLTVNHISRGINGNYVLEKSEVKSVIAGTEVDLVKEFTGYKADATQELTLTMPEKDTEVTVYYRPTGTDTNGNGKNDSEETYILTINHVSRGTKSNTLLEKETKSVVAETEVNLVKEFTGYKADATQKLTLTMPEKDTEVTVYYRPTGTDTNGNGKNDSEETYTLTINHVSRGTKSNTLLEKETKSVVVETEVNLVKEFTGYKADATQELTLTMPEKDTEVTVYYGTTGTDTNGNGKNDTEETYELTVNYVSVGENQKTTLKTEKQSVLVGNTVNIEKTFEGYTVKENQPKTVTMSNVDTVVTVYYRPNGIDSNGNGKNDTDETYSLTVVRVSKGSKSNTELERTTTPILAGEQVDLSKDIDGYTLVADQELTYVMPEAEVEVIVYYVVDGKDANNNGKNDRFEDKYTIRIHYVSINSNGKVGENIVPTPIIVKDDYVLGETYDITSFVNDKTAELSENYIYVSTDKAVSGIITADIATNRVVTITVSYQPKEGKDKNDDGVIDTKQAEITFLDYDDSEIYKDLITIGEETPILADPERVGYEFTGWSPAISKTVTGVQTYKATYRDTMAPTIDASVTVYKDKDNNEFAKINIMVTDNVEVAEVRYVEGEIALEEARNGKILEENGSYMVDGIQRNGYYTIYAKDVNGNESIQTVLVDNVEVPVGDFADKYTTGTLGRLNGFITDYSRDISIQTKEDVKIVDARIATSKYHLLFGNSYATEEQFNDPNFGTPIEHTDTTLNYTIRGDALERVTIYIKYSYQQEVGYGKYETRYAVKLYKTRLAQIFGD